MATIAEVTEIGKSATLTPRQTFRETVAAVAALAKAKLPTQVNGRVESAVKLVLGSDVTPQEDGSIEVGSSSDPLKSYTLTGTGTADLHLSGFRTRPGSGGLVPAPDSRGHPEARAGAAAGGARDGRAPVSPRGARAPARVRALPGCPDRHRPVCQSERAGRPQRAAAGPARRASCLQSPRPCPKPIPPRERSGMRLEAQVVIDGRQVKVALWGPDDADVQARLEKVLQQYPLPQSASPQGQPQGQGETPQCKYHGPMKASTKAPGTFYCTKKNFDQSYCRERFPQA